jgi:hypothetical protein
MSTVALPVRHSSGKWLNSEVFNEEGRRFFTHGYYTTEVNDSYGYYEYWDEQLDRCREGYAVGGQRITGDHYKYLNFTPILQLEDKSADIRTGRKIVKNPDFWDGDYDYYWCLEIARNGMLNKHSQASTTLEKEVALTLTKEARKELSLKILKRLQLKVQPHPDFLEGGYHMIIGKSRRKGFSFKNSSLCSNAFNTIRESLTVIGAFEKKHLFPEGTMGMASDQLSFINEHTAWGKGREYVDREEHREASYKKTINGITTKGGYKSSMMATTFKDNPDAARGKDAYYVLFEEAGHFPNLRASYMATKPTLEAGGGIITGQMLVFGTGGDMESGTRDFAYMFYHPEEFGFMPFINIWDKNASNTTCGYFHPVYLNMEGFYDAQGNSDTAGALQREMNIREAIRLASSSSLSMQSRVQEYPTCPSEAFLLVSINDFPIIELREQLNRVISQKLHTLMGKAVYLKPEMITETNVVTLIDPFTHKAVSVPARRRIKIEMDLKGAQEVLYTYQPTSQNIAGAVIIYEAPEPDAPPGLYKIGYDPYRQAQSTDTNPSLAAIYVYKTILRGSGTYNLLVASFVGRPNDPDDVNRIAEMLAELYNTQIMYENEVTSVKSYFLRKNKLHLLAPQPDNVISAAINNSKVARVWGMHMVEKLKDAGEKYIKKWLLTERDYDENGKVLLNLHFIYDPALLEELIVYNRKGNFDRVMALMMVMFQLAEDDGTTQYDIAPKEDTITRQLEELMNTQFRNTAIA